MKKSQLLELSFNSLEGTDRIVVTTNIDETIKKIDKPEIIGAVLTLIQRYRHGWTVPRGGVPVARIRLNFYQGDKILGNIGVGKGFLTAHQYGSFYSKNSDEGERRNMLEIIGLEANSST